MAEPTQPLETVTEPIRPGGGAPPEQARRPDAGPQLAEGVELLGRYEDSGYKEPPYMVRRPDGQMVQLPPILYLIAEHADGQRSYHQIAEEVSDKIQRGLDGDAVRMLAEEKLAPLGVLAGPDGSTPAAGKADPLLALKLKKAVIPAGFVRAVAAIFRPLFFPPVILGVLVALVALDVWLFFIHGVAQSMRSTLYQPLYLLLAFAVVVVAAAFHELGHASGCRYGGARPGAMGAGIYIVWPAFYTDVTDAYRLGKGGRLRTDLGGVYFNAIFILGAAAVFFLAGFEPVLILIYLLHLEIVRQLLPILRFDGYLVLSDLTGVPDLFSRMKPILVSLIPGRNGDKRVTELKPWVRLAVTAWVLAVVPFLIFNLVMILVFAPRIFATGWDSFWVQLDKTTVAFGEGSTLAGTTGVIQMLALALPAVGIAYGMSRATVRLSKRTWTSTEGRPALRFASFAAIAALFGTLGFVWWPDGDYKPIQPGEKWTVQAAVAAVGATASGEPAFADIPDRRVSEGTVGVSSDEPGSADQPGTDPTESPSSEPSEEPTDGSTTTPSPDPTETEVSPSPTETTTS